MQKPAVKAQERRANIAKSSAESVSRRGERVGSKGCASRSGWGQGDAKKRSLDPVLAVYVRLSLSGVWGRRQWLKRIKREGEERAVCGGRGRLTKVFNAHPNSENEIRIRTIEEPVDPPGRGSATRIPFRDPCQAVTSPFVSFQSPHQLSLIDNVTPLRYRRKFRSPCFRRVHEVYWKSVSTPGHRTHSDMPSLRSTSSARRRT